MGTYSYRIDPELENWLPKQDDEQDALHTELLKAEGCRPGSIILARISGEEHLVVANGHNTIRKCDRLKIERCEPATIDFGTRLEVKVWMVKNQLAGRNMTTDQKIEMAVKLREDGQSTRVIGEAVGVDQSTVVRWLNATDAIASVEEIVGRDGRKRKASLIPAKLRKIVPEIIDAVDAKLLKADDAAKLHKLDPSAQLMCLKMVLQDKTHATLAEAMATCLAPSDDDIPLDGKKQTPGEKPPPSEKELAQAAGMSVGEYRCWKEVEAKGCDKLVAAVKKKTVKTKDAWAILKQAPDFQEYALELFEEGDKKSLLKAIEGIEKFAKDGCPALITAVMEKKSIKLSEAEKILNDPKPIQERALTLYLAAVEAKDDKGPKSLKQAIGKVVICKNCLKAVRKHEDPPKDCTDCKLLQPKKKDKSGNVLFDDKIITDLMGKLSLAVDQRGSAIGKTAEYDRVGMVLDDLEAAWRQWRIKSS